MEHGLRTKHGKISGSIIKKIYDYERHHESKLLPKLTDVHFYFDTFEKMKVFLATQIISNSCATAIEKMLETDLFKNRKEAHATMEFCRLVNICFDLMNAKDINDPNTHKRGITCDNIDLLKDVLEYLKSIETLGKSKVYWIDGLIQTVNCIIGLYDERFSEVKRPILTRLVNQDPLENLFGQIRSQTINSQNPYLIDFLRILSRIISTKMDLNFKHGNCEQDVSTLVELIDLKAFKKEEKLPKSGLIKNAEVKFFGSSQSSFMGEDNVILYIIFINLIFIGT